MGQTTRQEVVGLIERLEQISQLCLQGRRPTGVVHLDGPNSTRYWRRRIQRVEQRPWGFRVEAVPDGREDLKSETYLYCTSDVPVREPGYRLVNIVDVA